MRLHATEPRAKNAIVLWDGLFLDGCIAVDTVEGWVDRVVCDDAGRTIPNADGTGPLIERMYGAFVVAFDRSDA
jgi:hypothetical protein